MKSSLNLRIDDREMLHNKVCTVLRSAILKGDFKPGERLVQTELAELIGVSRMPIREALRTLEMEGLVTLEPHRGAVVRKIDKKDIEEIYELRAVMEPLALKKGIEHFTKDDHIKLESYHQIMIETDNKDLYIEFNLKFHQVLISKCDNQRLLKFIETISSGFPQDTPQIIPGQIEKSNQEHAGILKAILEKKKERAAQLLANHIERTGIELIHAREYKRFS